MRYFLVVGTLMISTGSWCGSLGQAPVLSTPLEDAASPQLMQSLNQTTGSHGGAAQSAYGTAVWPVQPLSATATSPVAPGTTQPQLLSTPASGTGSFNSGQVAGLAHSSSRWTAGGAALSGTMLNRMGSASPAAGYATASSFASKALPRIGSSTEAQQLQASGSEQLLKQTAGFVPGAPMQYQAAPLIGNDGSRSAGAPANGSSPGTTQASPAQPASATEDAASSSMTGDWSRTKADAKRTFNVRLVTAPTSEGMEIRLIATADGLQLVLQTKNSLNGSILADQSGVSRHGGNATEGWWGWGAGAGSWAPLNVSTSSPLTKFKDPGENLTKRLDPASKLNQAKAPPEE